MQIRQRSPETHSRGMSLVGLIFILGILAAFVVLASKVAPTVVEYMSIKRAIKSVKSSGASSSGEIQSAFNKQAEVGYITSISGRDLILEKTDMGVEIGFSYTKKIPLFGPASLLLEYEGTTAKSGASKKKEE